MTLHLSGHRRGSHVAAAHRAESHLEKKPLSQDSAVSESARPLRLRLRLLPPLQDMSDMLILQKQQHSSHLAALGLSLQCNLFILSLPSQPGMSCKQGHKQSACGSVAFVTGSLQRYNLNHKKGKHVQRPSFVCFPCILGLAVGSARFCSHRNDNSKTANMLSHP